jgi:hypothetical protein
MQQPPRPVSPLPPLAPPRSYNSLRMLAGACIISAWLTLVLSVLFGLGMLAAPSPSAMPGMTPSFPGAGDLGAPPSPGAGQLGPLLTVLMPGLKMFGVVSTIGGGILSFFFLAALGQGLYLLLDMEENTRITAQALAQIARRQGT